MARAGEEEREEVAMSETAKCELCGEPMPPGETMFKFHGYSGPCPKPLISQPKLQPSTDAEWRKYFEDKCRELRKKLSAWEALGTRFVDYLERDEPEDADDDLQDDCLRVFGEDMCKLLNRMY